MATVGDPGCVRAPASIITLLTQNASKSLLSRWKSSERIDFHQQRAFKVPHPCIPLHHWQRSALPASLSNSGNDRSPFFIYFLLLHFSVSAGRPWPPFVTSQRAPVTGLRQHLPATDWCQAGTSSLTTIFNVLFLLPLHQNKDVKVGKIEGPFQVQGQGRLSGWSCGGGRQ